MTFRPPDIRPFLDANRRTYDEQSRAALLKAHARRTRVKRARRAYTRHHAGPLTVRTRLLLFIQTYIEREGIAPTYDEMAAALGMGKGNIAYHLRALEAAGWVARRPNLNRSLELLRPVYTVFERKAE